ncbi:hypothetical protein J2W91_004718 [Paenibacillus amylolyticus]|uniref:Uncharacterized protein n=1 Tax=Paenibacillus amylolyticus TaxID=1451 RepID=A0AAP5H5I6_PAEAM|nr:hypothetical protein [Paenibacillus amylolyticus]MDR6726212.1 hypothetical protein [Paenibacillus amylolyticus]
MYKRESTGFRAALIFLCIMVIGGIITQILDRFNSQIPLVSLNSLQKETGVTLKYKQLLKKPPTLQWIVKARKESSFSIVQTTSPEMLIVKHEFPDFSSKLKGINKFGEVMWENNQKNTVGIDLITGEAIPIMRSITDEKSNIIIDYTEKSTITASRNEEYLWTFDVPEAADWLTSDVYIVGDLAYIKGKEYVTGSKRRHNAFLDWFFAVDIYTGLVRFQGQKVISVSDRATAFLTTKHKENSRYLTDDLVNMYNAETSQIIWSKPYREVDKEEIDEFVQPEFAKPDVSSKNETNVHFDTNDNTFKGYDQNNNELWIIEPPFIDRSSLWQSTEGFYLLYDKRYILYFKYQAD